MDKSKTNKAIWDPAAHRIFIQICKEEVLAKNRPTHCLNVQGYNNLIAKFKARTNRDYTRKQFKNRWDSLKKDWIMWKILNQHASGLGRDVVSGTISASDTWWEQQIAVRVIPQLNHLIVAKCLFGSCVVVTIVCRSNLNAPSFVLPHLSMRKT